MNTIYKYELHHDCGLVILEMPEGSKVLTVQSQGSIACLWAMVDTDKQKVERRFRIIGTGHGVDCVEELRYISTYQLLEGRLIFHVFEVMPSLP